MYKAKEDIEFLNRNGIKFQVKKGEILPENLESYIVSQFRSSVEKISELEIIVSEEEEKIIEEPKKESKNKIVKKRKSLFKRKKE